MTNWNITAHGNTYDKPEDAPANLFWIDPKGHWNFWCSVTGGKSGTSSSPRTELREVDAEGKLLNFSCTESLHRMSGRVRVEVAPSSRKVVIAQIHAKNSDGGSHAVNGPFAMIIWWDDHIGMQYRDKPDGEMVNILKVPCKLGEVRLLLMSVINNTLYINVSGSEATVAIDESWKQYPLYFKAGAYVIDNVGCDTEGGWVVYESLSVEHLG